MTHSQWDYLSTEILTSPPQKLRLLLLEGAVRFVRRTEWAWENGNVEEGYQYLERARAIVSELLVSINKEVLPELAERVAALYRFVYIALAEAGLTRNLVRLREAAKILEMERDTWREVCQKLGGQAGSSQSDFSVQAKSAMVPPQSSETAYPLSQEVHPGGGEWASSKSEDAISVAPYELNKAGFAREGDNFFAGGSFPPHQPSSFAPSVPPTLNPLSAKRESRPESAISNFVAEA